MNKGGAKPVFKGAPAACLTAFGALVGCLPAAVLVNSMSKKRHMFMTQCTVLHAGAGQEKTLVARRKDA